MRVRLCDLSLYNSECLLVERRGDRLPPAKVKKLLGWLSYTFRTFHCPCPIRSVIRVNAQELGDDIADDALDVSLAINATTRRADDVPQGQPSLAHVFASERISSPYS